MIDLRFNNFSGTLPWRFGDLALLECLVLSHNELARSIPSKSFSFFHQINIPESIFVHLHGLFDLSYNRLAGQIPEEHGNRWVVVEFFTSNNKLYGEIQSHSTVS